MSKGISYELAKQLKNAGFPQIGIPHPDTLIDPEVVALPTLSELLEALGDKIWNIEYKISVNKWVAMSFETENISVTQNHFFRIKQQIQSQGSTPEEAVANLWLELNNKNKLC